MCGYLSAFATLLAVPGFEAELLRRLPPAERLSLESLLRMRGRLALRFAEPKLARETSSPFCDLFKLWRFEGPTLLLIPTRIEPAMPILSVEDTFLI